MKQIQTRRVAYMTMMISSQQKHAVFVRTEVKLLAMIVQMSIATAIMTIMDKPIQRATVVQLTLTILTCVAI